MSALRGWMGELVRKATGTSTHVPATHCWRNNNTGTTRWRTTTMPCDTTTAPCASRKRSWESTTPILHSSATTLGSCTGEWVSCADCHACVHSRMRWRCRHGLVRVCIFTCAYRRFGVHVHTGHSEIALSYYQRAMSIHEHRFGKNHPNVSSVCTNLAVLYQQQHCLLYTSPSPRDRG